MDTKKCLGGLNKKKPFFLAIGLLLILIFGFGAMFLSSCTPLPDEMSRERIINSFLPNLWIFIANAIAIVFLLLLLVIFAWRPTKRILDERSKLIQKEIDSARNVNQIAERLRAEAEKLKINAYQSADAIIYDAQFSAYAQKKEIINNAKNSANEIIANANREILRREQDLREQLKKETVKIVFMIAEELLSRSVTNADNEKMINELMNKISE